MFQEARTESKFQWSDLGNIKDGRPNLGEEVPLWAYRLMQYTMRDVLITEFGPLKAGELIARAGFVAGRTFCRNLLPLKADFNEFVATLQRVLKDQKIGILRLEKTDLEKLEFKLTVAEDLDCSGLPLSNETICAYDEGFLAGVLQEYTGKVFQVKEVDCWATGERVCRFEAKPQ